MIRRSTLLLLALAPACTTQQPADSVGSSPDAAPADDSAWARQYVSTLTDKVSADPQLSVLNALESAVAQAQTSVLTPWVDGWTSGDATAFSSLLADGVGLKWASSATSDSSVVGGINESAWDLQPGADESADYLASFGSIEHFAVDVIDVATGDGITSLTLRFDLRGTNADGQLRHDRGYLGMDVTGQQITDLSVVRMERLVAQRAPAFADVSSAWGLDAIPVESRKEAIRRGGYALVVADYDGDAKADLLVGNYGPVSLLRNTGSGWEDVTKQAGLDLDGVVKSAGFADMDNDGDRDLLLLRFVVGQDDHKGDLLAYTNNGDGTFTAVDDVLPKARQYDRAMPMTLGDFDADGNVDIYIGFPGIRDFTSGISDRGRPEWLASQGIWFNNGDWSFREADASDGVIADNNVYAHAALATDMDGDGALDLLVVDDSGRLNPVYKNDGSGSFTQIADQAGVGQGGLSMGAVTGDFNNDGLLDIMTTNITLTAGQRMASASEGLLDAGTRMGQVMNTLRDEYKSVQLYVNNGDGTFSEVSDSAGIEWTGDAAAAGEWLDYNHDGLLDYYLPNGLWSSGTASLDSLFFRAEIATYGDAILGYIGDEVDESDPMANDVHGRPIFATNGGPNPILSVLRNHKADGADALTYSMAAAQRNALFRNNGDGTFTEVGFLEGADRVEDGYIVAPVDIDGDGRQDLVLRNTDPAPGQTFRPVVALHNQLEGNALTVKLSAEGSNTDGLGARVVAHIGDQQVVREIRAVNGAVQAEPVAYIGLGDATVVDRLEVVWPGGDRQELTDVAAGSVTVTR